jgi:UDP-N-acetylmuramoylalanine--D-glutamate ligase
LEHEPPLPNRVLVVGLARSGEAAALALARRGVSVVGVDRNAGLEAGRLRGAGVEVHLGADDDSALLDRVELLVKSPGVPSEATLVAAARAGAIPVWGEIELGVRLVGQPAVGITGTNGKTTTTELIGAMVRADGREAAVCGNVGLPVCALDGALTPGATIICELSSFQLEDARTLRPHVAVLLNLAPDHLDRHGTFTAYRDAKLRIFENQGEDDVAVVPPRLGAIPGRARQLTFTAADPLPDEPRIPGPHNRENAAAAVTAARALGVADDAIGQALRTFPGVPHRLENVREVGGVRFVNDSKATNPESAIVALRSFPPGVRIILGGSRKDTPFAALAREARERSVARAYVIGETAEEIALALEREDVDVARCGDLETAVRTAAGDASVRDVVLLSPACASFDQFRDFEDRGDRFRALVEVL